MLVFSRNQPERRTLMNGITPEAELALFAPQTRLFRQYSPFLREGVHPVTELREALVLLYDGCYHRTGCCLQLEADFPDGTRGPGIEVTSYGGPLDCEVIRTPRLFPVSPELLAEMQRRKILSGTPHMGYTDEKELHLNERSTFIILQEINAFEEEQFAKL